MIHLIILFFLGLIFIFLLLPSFIILASFFFLSINKYRPRNLIHLNLPKFQNFNHYNLFISSNLQYHHFIFPKYFHFYFHLLTLIILYFYHSHYYRWINLRTLIHIHLLQLFIQFIFNISFLFSFLKYILYFNQNYFIHANLGAIYINY